MCMINPSAKLRRQPFWVLGCGPAGPSTASHDPCLAPITFPAGPHLACEIGLVYSHNIFWAPSLNYLGSDCWSSFLLSGLVRNEKECQVAMERDLAVGVGWPFLLIRFTGKQKPSHLSHGKTGIVAKLRVQRGVLRDVGEL